MNILISACLLGVRVRYDGKSKVNEDAVNLLGKHHLIPVCAEVMGGLPTPRVPAERIGDKVINRDGVDVTEQYKRGAAEIVRLAKLYDCKLAILKERSPSCGSGAIYDGTFSGTLKKGDGVLAQRLKEAGVYIIGEGEIPALKSSQFYAELLKETD